jgi:hypothetical protein
MMLFELNEASCVWIEREIQQPLVLARAAVNNQAGCHHTCLHQLIVYLTNVWLPFI